MDTKTQLKELKKTNPFAHSVYRVLPKKRVPMRVIAGKLDMGDGETAPAPKDAAKIRAALNKLIDLGLVIADGVARARTYSRAA